jgi:predicted phage terminase large subunit-like protein
MAEQKHTKESIKAYKEWQALVERIRSSQAAVPVETVTMKRDRIERLKGDFTAFTQYYLSDFIDCEFGWFHRKAAKEIPSMQNGIAVLEWPREHAKSIFADLMMPMYLYARGELSGMVVVSANGDKAAGLLGDLQAQFVGNRRWIADYGELAAFGSWSDGHFATTDSIGFWALGRGQSPRGIRQAANRPNYAVIDDIDDKTLVKNEGRVREAVDWVLEDLWFALSIKGARLVVAGNRIHKKSVLAHLVGDIEPDDPKREKLVHIKVYAFESKTHKKADHLTGQPAWIERYTAEQLLGKMATAGYRASRREFFHEHIEEGLVFKHTWVQWRTAATFAQYTDLVLYGDPSFKNTKDSDYKAWVLVGKRPKELGGGIDILKAWVRQASIINMVQFAYDMYEYIGAQARYYIETNMLQDLFLDAFIEEGHTRGYQLPIRGDKEKKPDKFTRIENLSPLFERGHFYFAESERQSPDMQTLIAQLLAFPTGSHDDGPDALEGATQKLQRSERASRSVSRFGSFKYSNKYR